MKKIILVFITIMFCFYGTTVFAEDEFGDAFGNEFGDEFGDESSYQEKDSLEQSSRDIFEPFNRVIFRTYKISYDYFFLYVTKAYIQLPSFVTDRVHDFSQNIVEPINIINNLLQLKINSVTESAFRFLINSTFGIFGMWDIMSIVGVPEKTNDFGATLAHYGIGDGPTIFLFGVSNLRDTLGFGFSFLYGQKIALYNIGLLHQKYNNYKPLVTIIDFSKMYYENGTYLSQSLDEYTMIKDIQRELRKKELEKISTYN